MRILQAVLATTTFFAVLMCLGCGSATETGDNSPGATAQSDPLTIAVIPKCTGGEFWETVEAGAMEAAKDLNVTVKWEGTLTVPFVATFETIALTATATDGRGATATATATVNLHPC